MDDVDCLSVCLSVCLPVFVFLLLPRLPHSDVHTSLLGEGSSFPEILWAAVELCLQGCVCWPCPCSQVVVIRVCLEDVVWRHLSRIAGAFTIRSNASVRVLLSVAIHTILFVLSESALTSNAWRISGVDERPQGGTGWFQGIFVLWT